VPRSKEIAEGAAWEYELKLDGYRALAVKREGRVTLFSRNTKQFNGRRAMRANGDSLLSSDPAGCRRRSLFRVSIWSGFWKCAVLSLMKRARADFDQVFSWRLHSSITGEVRSSREGVGEVIFCRHKRNAVTISG